MSLLNKLFAPRIDHRGMSTPSEASRLFLVITMLGIVILLWVLAQFVVLIAAGFLDGDLDGDFGPVDGLLIIAGSLCSAPLVILLLYMRRPKLEQEDSTWCDERIDYDGWEG